MRSSFAEGRLYYFGARWYDPELGLWISPDPAHQFASPYAYGYAPNMGVDPNGELFGIDDAIAAGIGFGKGYIQSAIRTGDVFSMDNLKAGGAGAVGAWVGYNVTVLTGGNVYAGAAAGGAASGMAGEAFEGHLDRRMVRAGAIGAASGLASAGVNQLFGDANVFMDFAGDVSAGYVGGASSAYMSGNWSRPDWDQINTEGAWGAAFSAGDFATQPMQNASLGLGWRFNAQLNVNGNMAIVDKAEDMAYADSRDLWAAEPALPDEYGGDLPNTPKCSRFVHEATGAPDGFANNMATAAKRQNLAGADARAGDAMYLRTAESGKGGHALVVGRNGDLIHASNVLGGARISSGIARVVYVHGLYRVYNKGRVPSPIFGRY